MLSALDKTNIKEVRMWIYSAICCRFPFLWKLMRFLLFGKIDFNDEIRWENNYIDSKNIKNLLGRVPGVVEKILNIVKDCHSILEVSSGYGNFILKVPKEKNLTATEFNNQCVSFLKMNKINAIKAQLPFLPFEKNTFDAVVSISVFEHLHNKKVVKKSFSEICRITKDLFILSVPYKSMQPWKNLMHNFDFSKSDILRYTKKYFYMDEWIIDNDNNSKRSIFVLRKKV